MGRCDYVVIVVTLGIGQGKKLIVVDVDQKQQRLFEGADMVFSIEDQHLVIYEGHVKVAVYSPGNWQFVEYGGE